MLKYHVRDLMFYTEAEIWGLPKPARCELTFDDNVTIETDTVNIMIGSWYLWSIAANWPQIQVNHKLFIYDNVFTDSLFRELLWDAIESTTGLDVPKEDVWLLAYELYNRSYNAIVNGCNRFISSISYKDILEVADHPRIAAAMSKVNDSREAINHVYDEVDAVFKDPAMAGKTVIDTVSYGTVKMDQARQSFGPRGPNTDIDSVIYSKPILRGFVHGLATLDAFAMESRSAAKAQLFNKDPVADAEYFNRKMQLVCGIVRKIVPGDCGTRDYHTFFIPDDSNGKRLFESMVGLYQVMPDGKMREIRSYDTHLIGTTVNFRSSLCCLEGPNQGVCEVCYGAISYAIPYDTNPGHVSSTSINEPATQTIISTKHLDFIRHSFPKTLPRDMEHWFSIAKSHAEHVLLKRDVDTSNLRMSIAVSEAQGLVDINYVSTPGATDIAKISSLSSIQLFKVDDRGYAVTRPEIVQVVRASIQASLSPSMLKYLKVHSWERDGNRYIIDLSKWNKDHPVLIYQNKHENMSAAVSRIETFLRSTRARLNEDMTPQNSVGKNTPMLVKYRDVDAALYDAYYIICDKLSGIHLGHIATVLMASRAVDPVNGDWSMPAGKNQGYFCSHDELIRHRSLAVAMLFERQSEIFDDPDSYLESTRTSSILDDLVYIPPSN